MPGAQYLGHAPGLGDTAARGEGRVTLEYLADAADAVVGYVDTRIAFAAPRVVSPFEQHVHSVLDMAPVVALGWYVASTWPAAVEGDWALQARRPMPSAAVWFALLAPAMALCVVPALFESRAAWRARAARR